VLKLSSGVIAATVTLSNGSDSKIEQWWSPDSDGVILFGASDLLEIKSDVFEFGASTDEPRGRTANTYLAAALHDPSAKPPSGLFRALSFFRAQRPQHERLTTNENLHEILGEFHRICDGYDVSCRVLLGYGWADLYLHLGCESLNGLFAAIVGCRSLTLASDRERGVFQNAFTIVGIDSKRVEDAGTLIEPVSPQLSLRVTPSELRGFIMKGLPFDDDHWNKTVTSGKRDIFITPKDRVPFGEFWKAHHEIRQQIGKPEFPVHKMETHFDFVPDDVLPPPQKTAPSERCHCSRDGKTQEASFRKAAKACKVMGPGLKQSFEGLANLYREALGGRENCCDFDAAAAHLFSQRKIFMHYQQLCDKSLEYATIDIKHLVDEAALAEVLRTVRRRDLLRDAIERLEVSSVFIFNQEQNGSYSDLLSRSERVSLYRGGMQKINVALLIAIDGLIERVIRRAPTFNGAEFRMVPMLCWWPAGQIQSERPTGVVKVPVFYLHQPEVAFFLIIHELGQLIAFEHDGQKPVSTAYSTADFEKMLAEGILLGTTQDAESLGVDTGKFITDLRADVLLLRAGFANDIARLHRFLLDQFLLLIESEHGLSLLYVRCAQFMARMTCIAAAAAKFKAAKGNDAQQYVLTKEDRARAAVEVRKYLTPELIDQRSAVEASLAVDLLDPAVLAQAEKWVDTYHEWVEEAMRYVDEMAADAEAPAASIDLVREGWLTEIDSAQITSYFRALLSMKENGADARSLFRARAALISSILGYCERKPRLEQTTTSFEK